MPRKKLMSWTGAPYYRWRAMRSGQVFMVKCSELGLPKDQWTEQGSMDAANEWFADQLAQTSDKASRIAQNGDRAIQMAIAYSLADKGREIATRLSEWFPDHPEILRFVAELEAKKDVEFNEKFSFGECLKSWLESKKRKRNGSPTTQKSLNQMHSLSRRWSEIFPSTFDCREFNAKHVSSFMNFVLNLKTLDGKRDNIFAKQNHCMYFKQFLKWIFKQEILDSLPRNIDDIRFTTPSMQVPEISLQSVKRVIANLKNDWHKLLCFLVLNTSANNSDIALMKKSDIRNGIWTRKRVKTAHLANSPVVSYKLWPETLSLLAKFKSKDPELWLLNKVGKPLYVNGKKDNISQQWENGDYFLTLKDLRKSPAQLLKSHDSYFRFAKMMLSHTDKDITSKHYAGEDTGKFWEALAWLRTQYLS